MTAKGFIVRGKGNPDSLNSASHGAGRAHSRGECRSLFTQHDIKKELKLKECHPDGRKCRRSTNGLQRHQ
jgi:tRNA-splicing ligase RtcB